MFQVIKYTPEYFDRWNRFVDESDNGTIFHRLDFLDYHRNRFKGNEHHLIWLKGETIFAIMPFLITVENGQRIGKSPYGASFGGLVYGKRFHLKHALEVYGKMAEYLMALELDEVSITTTPYFYSQFPTNYFEYVLSRSKYQIYSRDVFSAVPIIKTYKEVWKNFEGRARTSINKARDNFVIALDVPVSEFYQILLEDKIRHNNSRPTHSLQDLEYLKQQFPDRVYFDIATLKKNGARAGICYFVCNLQVIMTFYMAQENKALKENGTNILLEHGFKRAIERNVKYLDFGSSTLGYNIQNIGVCEFKESFGAKGFFRDSFRLKMS